MKRPKEYNDEQWEQVKINRREHVALQILCALVSGRPNSDSYSRYYIDESFEAADEFIEKADKDINT